MKKAIKVGQKWQDSDGAIGTVTGIQPCSQDHEMDRVTLDVVLDCNFVHTITRRAYVVRLENLLQEGNKMEQFDPYEFLNKNLEPRPFDKDKNRDGNVHYIHQCDVWTLIKKMQSENNKQMHTNDGRRVGD